MIVDEEDFYFFLVEQQVILVGDGVEKRREVLLGVVKWNNERDSNHDDFIIAQMDNAWKKMCFMIK